MKLRKTKKSKEYIPRTEAEKEQVKIRGFLDLCSPSVLKFYPDYYICGNAFRSVWAIREYPTKTDETALLRHLGDRSGITLRIYTRAVSSVEEKKIFANATSVNLMNRNSGDVRREVVAQENMKDIVRLMATAHSERELFLHCAVFIDISAPSQEKLKAMQADVEAELTRSKIAVDKLFLRQKEGFESVQPCGKNRFGIQFERVLPAASTANLYPFNYSGKADPEGFYIGYDKYGSNLFIDFRRKTADKTNSNILILGNSGEGKSYLMKLLLCNTRESGMDIVCLDVESEYADLTENLGGCYIDLMEGRYLLNVLEPKRWEEGGAVLSRHISFLRDFFRSYKDFSSAETDVLEILLERLYESFGITENRNLGELEHDEFPILSDLYALAEQELSSYKEEKSSIYTPDSRFFNGHTNVTSDSFLCFGVRGIMDADVSIRNAMLFNVLSYMSDALLSKGHTAAFIDEVHAYLSNTVAVEYIRNAMKRVRKRESAVVLASQNIEDFNQPGVKELTKPLFTIPTHQFLFHPGKMSKSEYMEMLHLEESLFDLISHPAKGVCVFRHGSEVFHLVVKAEPYKERLFYRKD